MTRVEQVAQSLGVSANIHAEDFLLKFNVDRAGGDADKGAAIYLQLGKYSADLLRTDVVEEAKRIQQRRNITWEPRAILDFASGYGCVARHLPKTFPDSSIEVCDIHPQAVDFCAREFGIGGFVSRADPKDFNTVRKHDFVFALSFFSHMPKRSFLPWLSWLRQQITEGGIVAFTARGDAATIISGVAIPKDSDEFGFIAKSEQGDLDGNQYGLALSPYPFVLRQLEAASLQLLFFRQCVWWRTQDLYVCTAK